MLPNRLRVKVEGILQYWYSVKGNEETCVTWKMCMNEIKVTQQEERIFVALMLRY